MNSSKLTLASQTAPPDLGDGYLKFQLNNHTSAVLPIIHTQEAIVVPVESITAMPNMPACILGLMNWRSRIVWAIDLPNMLNIESQNNRLRQYNVIVIRVESTILGLVVPEIKGTTRLMPDAIQSPREQVPSNFVPYLRGCVWQEKKILLVLEAQAIVQSSILHNN